MEFWTLSIDQHSIALDLGRGGRLVRVSDRAGIMIKGGSSRVLAHGYSLDGDRICICLKAIARVETSDVLRHRQPCREGRSPPFFFFQKA